MANEEKIFADGFSFKRNEKAPDFVVGRLSIKADDGEHSSDSTRKVDGLTLM